MAERLQIAKRTLQALERDAHLFRDLMDPHELEQHGSSVAGAERLARAEALRRTARGAVEDWLEVRRTADAS
jgi:hypothetical protein